MIWYFILYIELFIRLCHKYYIILYFKLSIVLYIKFEIILQYILNYTVSYIIFYHIIFIFFFDPTKEYITYLTQDWHLARVVVCFPLTFWQSSYFSAMLSSETRSFLPPQPSSWGGAKGLCKALVLLLLFNFSVVLQTTVTRLWTIKHLHILHADCPITTHDSFLSSFFYLEYGTLWLLRAFKHTLLQSHSHPDIGPILSQSLRAASKATNIAPHPFFKVFLPLPLALASGMREHPVQQVFYERWQQQRTQEQAQPTANHWQITTAAANK